MKSKFTIVEDTVTPYLEKLYEFTSDPFNHEAFLKDAAQELHFDYIEPLMPKWNPNLMFSPLEQENQVFKPDGGLATLDLIYTGKTEMAEEREWDKDENNLYKVYWEFGDKFTGELHRDYAYYQETGQDDIAKNFGGHHFVKRGTSNYLNQYHARVQAYADSLLRGNNWKTEARIDRFDYVDDYLEKFY